MSGTTKKAVSKKAADKKSKIVFKNMGIRPLADRVIVKSDPAEEKTAGGIIIPEMAKETPKRGTVVAAGPGRKDEQLQVALGDRILYGKFAGTELEWGGEKFLIMRDTDIFAVLENEVNA